MTICQLWLFNNGMPYIDKSWWYLMASEGEFWQDRTGNEARSRNHCFRGNAISITYCKTVSVDLGIQYAMRMRHIAICGQPEYKMYFHVIS